MSHRQPAESSFRGAIDGPIELPENRVYRFYRGGTLLDAFRGAARTADSDLPEDWVGSVTSAWQPRGSAPAEDGLSRVRLNGQEVLLADLLRADAEALAGRALVRAAGPTTGLLVKLLDSVVRLPVHCHPSRSFARRTLGSFFGKTEAWIVLETRQIPGEDAPHVRLGFRRDVDRDEIRDWIERQDVEALLGAMHARPTAPGDVWLVPAGMPHAIGAGIFLVELQEPTDFSIVAEIKGYPIAMEDAHLGLGWDVMVDCFDRRGLTETALSSLHRRPDAGSSSDGTLTPLLGESADPFFRAYRLQLHAEAALPFDDTFVVGIVLAGGGELVGRRSSLPLRRGVTFALPAASVSAARLVARDPLEILLCLPPVAAGLS